MQFHCSPYIPICRSFLLTRCLYLNYPGGLFETCISMFGSRYLHQILIDPLIESVYLVDVLRLYDGADGIVINMVVGGEVALLKSLEETCGFVIAEMPIHVHMLFLTLTLCFASHMLSSCGLK